MIGRIGLILALLVCAVAQAQQPDERGGAITALGKRYEDQPHAHFLVYLLARFNADAGRTEVALDWLDKLARQGWELGINPRDFPSLQASEEFFRHNTWVSLLVIGLVLTVSIVLSVWHDRMSTRQLRTQSGPTKPETSLS